MPDFLGGYMAIKIFKFNDYEFHVCTDRMMDEYIEGFFDLKIQENGDEADIYFDAELLFKEFFNTLSKTRVVGDE